MNSEQIQALLQQAFSQAHIMVSGQSGKFDITITDDIFEGKRPVQRQQMVYAPLTEQIASGAIHAVTIKARTVEEKRKADLFGA